MKMPTMKRQCTIILHLILISTTLIFRVNASEKLSLSMLALNEVESKRGPSNFIPQDELYTAPIENKPWINYVFVETNEGNLNAMKDQFDEWSEREEYVKNWNLESTGMYDIADQKKRKNYFNRQLLKYADKRLSGEVKNAEEGSNFHKIGQVEKAVNVVNIYAPENSRLVHF